MRVAIQFVPVGANRVIAALAAASILLPSAAAGQELRLGTVGFANSGAPEAQGAFERGLLLLHSFEYWDAADAFRVAREIDPDFAMAYWGEAMTHNHPVWMRQDREAALAALDRFAPTPEQRAAKAGPDAGGTEREAAYMRAVDVLYGAGGKEARDVAYLEAMAALHEAHPDDVDAAAFHALALLGTAHEGRDFTIYMRSAGILEQVVDRHPNHPGVAHYLIHSYDDPIHAPLGIRAARAYSAIAPDAPHAQHMTSHIFVALGMWDDVVEANENSLRVLDNAGAADGQAPAACGHYNFWLEYGYLEQGRDEEALRLVRECYDRVGALADGATPAPDATPVDSYTRMLARYVVDAGDSGSEALDWPIDLDRAPNAAATRAFAAGHAAARRGDPAGLSDAMASFAAARQAIGEAREVDGAGRQRLDLLASELEALRLGLGGDLEAAIELARQAAEDEAAMPLEFGPPFIEQPTHELLGELLLAAGRPAEAREAFETALSRTPGRSVVLDGLARAEAELTAAD